MLPISDALVQVGPVFSIASGFARAGRRQMRVQASGALAPDVLTEDAQILGKLHEILQAELCDVGMFHKDS